MGAIPPTGLPLIVKMVHFLGIASLLLFFQIALAVADSVPRKYKGNVVGRWSCASDESESYNIQLNSLSYSPYA